MRSPASTRGLSESSKDPVTVTFPPPDSAVRFRKTAPAPLKITLPLALEIPFGHCVSLNETFLSCNVPLNAGLEVLPRTVAANTTLPDDDMSRFAWSLQHREVRVSVQRQVHRSILDRKRTLGLQIRLGPGHVGAVDPDRSRIHSQSDRFLILQSDVFGFSGRSSSRVRCTDPRNCSGFPAGPCTVTAPSGTSKSGCAAPCCWNRSRRLFHGEELLKLSCASTG